MLPATKPAAVSGVPPGAPPGSPHGAASGAAAWVAVALGLLLGTAAQLQQGMLWPPTVLWALAAGALLLGLLALRLQFVGGRARRRHGWILRVLLLGLAAAGLAFSLTSARAWERLSEILPAALEDQDLLLSGRVVSLPRVSTLGTQFDFEIDRARLQGRPLVPGGDLPRRVSLAWYSDRDGGSMGDAALMGGAPETLQAGQRWQFMARLRQPHGLANPHGFDLELWLFERGIRASGSLRLAAEPPPRLLPGNPWMVAPVQRLRQAVRDAIAQRVRDPALAGVLSALVVGDQAAIVRDDWDVFRITGVAHLMSISGLHVTMLAWLAAALIGRLWRLSARAPLLLPAQQAARWGGLLVALVYALLAGFGVPAQRTVAMLGAVVLLRGAGFRWPLWAVLLAAAVVVTLLDPWALLQPGFWLSFVAVGLLAYSEPVARPQGLGLLPPLALALASATATSASASLDPAPGWAARLWARWGPGARTALQSGLRTQAVATVGLAPLSLLFFHQLSLVGFVANLVAIPLVTLLITPLALLGMLAPPLWTLAASLVNGLMAFLQALAALPLAQWQTAAAPLWAVVCGLLAAALAIAPLPPRLRWLALPLMLPLLAPPLQQPAAGEFELLAVDVGQGTAVLVRTRHELLVYDAGPMYSSESDAGGRVLLPLLRARGERRISLLMLSHRDSDHVGGAAALLKALPVNAMSSSLEPGHPLLAMPGSAAAVPHQACQAGQRWTWDGVQFEVLHPIASDLARAHRIKADPTPSSKPVKANSLSCVLRVSGGGRSALLTGDAEAPQEVAMIERAASPQAVPLQADLLIVPHHGSRTSSTAEFIAAVQPRWALAQAAYRSRFGHPAPDVVARYEAAGVALLRSDRCGALWWPAPSQVDGPGGAAAEGLFPLCQRQLSGRYWHHGAGLTSQTKPP